MSHEQATLVSVRSLHVGHGLKKNGPIAGATFRGNEMVGMSGKAMHGTVPPARTAFREVTQIKESEGHTWFAASL